MHFLLPLLFNVDDAFLLARFPDFSTKFPEVKRVSCQTAGLLKVPLVFMCTYEQHETPKQVVL